MSPLIKNNEHFIGTFFYWMPSMIVLIFSREITEYLFVDLSSIIMFFVFFVFYTPLYIFVLRRFYKKRCATIFVEIFLIFAIYSSMVLWCYHSEISFFKNLAFFFNIEEDNVKNLFLIFYLLLIFEIVKINNMATHNCGEDFNQKK